MIIYCTFAAKTTEMPEKKELSILIPVYNSSCLSLVKSLRQQAEKLAIKYEVIVADDASPQTELSSPNEAINQWPHCRYIKKEQNTGSAATRNFLARQSTYEWLLFLDCDIVVPDQDFLKRYIDAPHTGVVNGGICIKEDASLGHNLRYIYERDAEPFHTAEKRQQMKYKEFRSTNFLICREDMLLSPFDERFKMSGYEDVLFGKHLKQAGINIHHINNPVMMEDFENNPDYMVKTERNLQTLHRFRHELKGYSRLLTLVNSIHIPSILSMIRCWHKVFGHWERQHLCGKSPSLKVFTLYRLGYYLTIKDETD